VEPNLIALHGVKGAGKSTTYQFIADWCVGSSPALSAVQRGFADKAKLAYMRQWVPDCTMEWAIAFVDQWKNDPDAKCIGVTSQLTDDLAWRESSVFIGSVSFRQHLAHFATEGARYVYGDDFWVDQLLPQQPTPNHPEGWRGNFLVPPRSAEEDPYSFAHFAVIADLRFVNELERVHSLGGICVKISRSDAELAVVEEAHSRGRQIHASELGITDDLFDVVLCNDDNDLEQARERTERLMEAIIDEGVVYVQSTQGSPWRIT
jgi:hypothetical protein